MLGIIIPAFNRPQLLREALGSLTIQTMPRFLVCVVDDASTENLKAVCDEFDTKLHICYIRQEKNQGPGAARERGLQWAYQLNLELIMFLDSDDLLFPNATEVLTYEINHGRYDFVCSNIAMEQLHNPQFTINATESITWHHGTIYRTSFLKQNDIHFITTLHSNEDLAFNLCTFLCTENKGALFTPLYLWRDHGDSITRSKTPIYYSCRSFDYVSAIYEVFKYALSHPTQLAKNALEWLIPNLFCCYNYYQIGGAMELEVPENMDEQLKEMITSPLFKDYLSNINNWGKYKNYIKPFSIEKKKIYFFRESFFCWWERLGGVIPGKI